jgi:zinc/manganese transport system substrate-binding protein
MRRRDLLLLPALWPATGPVLGSAPWPDDARGATPPPVRVVATFSILGDFVQQVGGTHVIVHSLVGPDSDAHVYEPRPGDVRQFTGASLVVMNGLGFEGWMPRLVRAAEYRREAIVASEGIEPRHANGYPDPHAWQDPRLARIYANNVLAGLSRAVPALHREFGSAAALFVARLDELDAELKARFEAIPRARRRVVTTHDAFAYFGAAYGIDFLPLRGWSTAVEASAADVAKLARLARTQGVAAAFVENITDPRLLRTFAADTGLRLGGRLYSDALAKPGHSAASYLGMMRHNAETLLAALSPAAAAEHSS